jgi:hypothetical protein
MNRNKLRALVATGAAAAILGVAGFAWAAFFEPSVATATDGAAAQMTPLLVESTQTDYEGSQTAMWPNHPADVVIVVKNENEVPVTVTSIVNNSLFSTNGWSSTCGEHIDIDPTIDVEGGLPTIAAGQSATLRLIDVLVLDNEAANTCQGATFTSAWTVVGTNA